MRIRVFLFFFNFCDIKNLMIFFKNLAKLFDFIVLKTKKSKFFPIVLLEILTIFVQNKPSLM